VGVQAAVHYRRETYESRTTPHTLAELLIVDKFTISATGSGPVPVGHA